jgi:hypothetical protein
MPRKKRRCKDTEDSGRNANDIKAQGIAKSRLFSIEKELGIDGLFDGDVYHLSFDCPKSLASAFKESTRANGTSVCKELQKYALSYVTADHIEKSAFGSTLSKILKPKVTIGELKFEQYVQSRPRRLLRLETGINGDNPEKSNQTCGIGDCKKPSTDKALHVPSGRVYPLCTMHANYYRELSSKIWTFRTEEIQTCE